MKIFLSALEVKRNKKEEIATKLIDKLGGATKFHYNLMSYYYIRARKDDMVEKIRDNSELVIIDSGAHSFQKGKQVNWIEYTKEYAEFIKRFDEPNVVGYFEMDVDNIIGYDKVLELRKILESVSDKIIPVWHKNRGLDEFKKMCKDYAGKVVAVTGFKNEDIKDEQYLMFLKYAHKYNCKVHCLGMTRKKVLDKVPFDYVDSSSWAQNSIYGRIGKRKVTREMSKTNRERIFAENYLLGMKMQEHYYEKWKKISKD